MTCETSRYYYFLIGVKHDKIQWEINTMGKYNGSYRPIKICVFVFSVIQWIQTSLFSEPIASINIDGASYNQSSRGETWKQNLYFGVQEPESWLSMNRGETTSGSARYSQSYYPQDLSGSCCEDFGQRNDRPMSISVAGRRSSSYMPNMATHAPEYFPFDQLKPSMIISNLTQQNLKSNGTFSRLDHRDGISESQIISEWRMIANVQNRVNAIFFCWLLFGILYMYYRSHAPSN